VVGQPVDMLDQAVRIEPLDRLRDPAMEGATSVLEQTAVGHLVGEGVLEGVLQVREQARLVQKLGLVQVAKCPP